ncbi:MAG: hypothetical protein FJ000_06265 [Actinobacteria bacterium]|nr:hypothetical protein [Actinomycetota bacterium]
MPGAPDPVVPGLPAVRPARIAVALDDAFAFYYEDNLRELRRAGADLVWCSPLTDASLPACDGLYLGGGYPELHAERLSTNTSFRDSVADAAVGGLPIYAECGGLLYLAEDLEDLDGHTRPMAGVVPARVRLHKRLQDMGYREARLASDCLLGPAGESVRGHEFHYSSCTIDYRRGGGPAYTLLDDDGQERLDGYADGSLFASYVHLHFSGCRPVVRRWLDACRRRSHDDRSSAVLTQERTA